MSQTQSSSGIVELGRVIVPVSDPDRAIDFYVGALGFEKVVDDAFGPGRRWIEVVPSSGSTPIALAPMREGDAAGVQTGIALTTKDIDTTRATLDERGVDVDEQVSRMGGPVPPMFWFRDQDGNTLMVVQPTA